MVQIRPASNLLTALVLVAALTACGSRETAHPLTLETPRPAPPIALDNTEWTLTSLNGNRPVEGSRITLVFYPGSYMEGDAGCNSYGVDYVANGNEFQIPVIHRTEFDCEVIPSPGRRLPSQRWLAPNHLASWTRSGATWTICRR